jgi:hypothetical protein
MAQNRDQWKNLVKKIVILYMQVLLFLVLITALEGHAGSVQSVCVTYKVKDIFSEAERKTMEQITKQVTQPKL